MAWNQQFCPTQGTRQGLDLFLEIAVAPETFSWESHFFGLKINICKNVLQTKTNYFIYFCNTTVEHLLFAKDCIFSYFIFSVTL